MRFFEVLNQVIGLLVRERRVTYQALKLEFGLDDAVLEGIRAELICAKRVAIDEDGIMLVWTGDTQRRDQAAATVTRRRDTPHATVVPSLASPTLPPLVTAADTVSSGPPEALSTAPTTAADNAPDDGHPVAQRVMPIGASEPVRSVSEAERRQLTVMFCDVVGSTDLSGQLDPEDLREVVRAYQETAAAVIHRYEGHIAQYLGDGLLVYFGYPQAHEDDAPRAVHTGLGIVEAMTTLNTRLRADYGVQLAVRLGIHTGPVVVGAMGGGGRHEQLALGETPNIAARLEGLAEPNTVVISAVTANLVRSTFTLEDLGRQPLKGVAASVAVARVRGPVEVVHDEEPRSSYGVVFLVGRDEEQGLLRRRWGQSKDGLGQVVLVRGEAGIGKSSLVEALRIQVRQAGGMRIAFRCSPYHTNSALYPVIEHVQRVLHWQRVDPPASKLDKMEQILRTYRLPLAEVVPLVAALLALPLPAARYSPLALTPQQQKQQTLDALVAWLIEEAERQPVLAVWEDLHWADPTTLEMLGLILDQTPTVPMLSVLTFRPEFVPPWPMRSHMTPITLNRLERPQVEALVAHLVGGKALPKEVVEHIVTKTDGVLLFVEELTKMLLESSLLHDEGGQYTLTGTLSAVAIPATLQDSLMARLDRLPTVRVVAQLGAVLGREFEYEMLRALAGMEEAALQEGLTQLVEAELLYQRGRPPRAKYVFKHALVQDAAYASLLRSTRHQYHLRTAQLLETRFPDIVATQPELLAHHYTEAGCTEQAIASWQRAGQCAKERSAHVEAIGHLNRGFEVLGTLPDTAERRQRELEFQIERGLSLIVTKGQAAPDVGQAYGRAYELCQQIEDPPRLFRVLWGLWHFHVVRAELQTVQEVGEQLLSLAQRFDDPEYLLGGHWALAGGSYCIGVFAAAREHWEQSLALYEAHRLAPSVSLYGSDLGVFSLCWASHAVWHLGYPDQALAMSRKALALARELEHPYSLALALDYAAMLHQFRREPQAVQHRAEATVALCAEHGFAYYRAWGMALCGWVRVEQGHREDGIAQLHEGLKALLATGASLRWPYYLTLLAEAYGPSGRIEDGLTLLSEALTRAQDTGERWHEAEVHRLRGELLLRQTVSDEQQAEMCFHQALAVARDQRAKSLELRAAMSLSRLWWQQGKAGEARELLADLYHWFTEGLDTADLQEAKALLTARA